MANNLLNPTVITRQALVEFKNNMVLLEKCDRQLDTRFTQKIGDTINVRKRVRFQSVDGDDITGQIQAVTEGNVPVVLKFRKVVPFEFSTEELTLTIEEFSDRYIRPAMIALVQDVESAIADQYKKLWWFTGTPGTQPSTYLEIGEAGAILDEVAVPSGMRNAFYDPAATVALADGLRGVFPQTIAKRAIEEATIGRYAGFEVIKSQSLKVHTVGNYGGTPLINGGTQNVTYESVRNTNQQDNFLCGSHDKYSAAYSSKF